MGTDFISFFPGTYAAADVPPAEPDETPEPEPAAPTLPDGFGTNAAIATPAPEETSG